MHSFLTVYTSAMPSNISKVAQWCPTLSTLWTVAYQAPLSMGFLLGADAKG